MIRRILCSIQIDPDTGIYRSETPLNLDLEEAYDLC